MRMFSYSKIKDQKWNSEVLLIENGAPEKRYPLSKETQGELISWFQSFQRPCSL